MDQPEPASMSATQQPSSTQAQPVFKAVPRIAIVSERAFHLEVLAGFISILERDYGAQLVVYMHPMNHENRQLDFGFTEFLEDQFGNVRALPWVGVPAFDLVISISPEYRLFYLREFIRRARPKAVIMMVHNGDAPALQEMATVHPNAHIVSLSPHVQRFVHAHSNVSIGWMLPLKALTPRRDCPDANLSKCLSGFAIQGAMDSKRRNYTSIFTQLDKLIRSSSQLKEDKRLMLNVVGSGRPEKLGVPSHLSTRIQPHTNLRFSDFYNLIHQNFALLPALASDAYYDRKFSSTLITSLVTGVPVLVEQRFLDSYSFLGPQHVVLQPPGGQVADAMQGMLESSSEQLAITRRNVATLREQLCQRALSQIKGLLLPWLPDIEKEWQQQPW